MNAGLHEGVAMQAADDDDARLNDLRFEIDSMDHELRMLLERRFEVVEHLRAACDQARANGRPGSAPALFPPAEIATARALLEARRDPLPAELLMRLWRLVTAETSARLSPMNIHCPRALAADAVLRDVARDHYGTRDLCEHGTSKACLKALAASPGDIAIMPVAGDWPGLLGRDGQFGQVKVLATLPMLSAGGPPQLVIIGHGDARPSGQDETLVVSSGHLPRDFALAPLWVCEAAGGRVLTSLPGYLSDSDVPLVGLIRGNGSLALGVLGRYPSPFEA